MENCKNIVDFFYGCCEKYAHNTLIYNNDGKSYSYSDINEISRKTYSFLKTYELRKDEKVSIILPNIPEFISLLLGVWSFGGVAVNLNVNFTAEEIKIRLQDAEVRMLITTPEIYQKLQPVIKEIAIEKILLVSNDADITELPIYNFEKLLSGDYSTAMDIPDFDSQQTAFLQYTGGTTGGIKAAVLTHGNILANVQQIREHFGDKLVETKEIMPATFPFYHVFALTFNIFSFVNVGAACLLYPVTRDLPQLIKIIKDHKITCFVGVNTMYKLLMQSNQLTREDLSDLKVCIGGGEHIQYKTKIDWQQLSGVPIYEAYGMTETSAMAIVNPINERNNLETIGTAIPRTEVRLLDENDAVITEDDVHGEIVLKGPQVVKQYWNKPDENVHSFTDGWLRTGDIAVWKNGNFLKIVDRKKDMISVSGFKVFPNEVEAVIAAFPGIMDCAVVGEKDEQTGERVVLYYMATAAIDEQALTAFCKEQLTAYKIPKKIIKTQLIPKTAIGKTMRSSLRKLHEII